MGLTTLATGSIHEVVGRIPVQTVTDSLVVLLLFTSLLHKYLAYVHGHTLNWNGLLLPRHLLPSFALGH